MNHVERFRAVMDFLPVDRLPVWEWAMWWDKTIARWHGEGLPRELSGVFEISQYFGHDPYYQFWFSTTQDTADAVQHHVEGTVGNVDDYLELRPRLYPAHERALESMARLARKQAEGEMVVWATLEGPFWFTRTLMGFEKMILAYYDQPELVHLIADDLLQFNRRLVERMCRSCVPTFMTFAEDMSYNHGPMLGRGLFDEFVAPFYRKILPALEEHGIIPIVDTDGDISLMTPWLLDVGLKGALPLERQAGVDAVALRRSFPRLRMIGHYDKMVMDKGEEAMRREFERLLPLMKTGGFIPSVDHQTPPGVSLAEYRVYLRLLAEYAVLGAP